MRRLGCVALLGAVGLVTAVGSPARVSLGEIVYTEDCHLYSVIPGVSLPRRVAPGIACKRQPAWSPDRRRIAYVVDLVWITNRSTEEHARILGSDEELPVGFPAWSPRGTHVVYSRHRGSGSELVVQPAAGGAKRRLTVRGGAAQEDLQPAWSPDGRSIAFTRVRGLVADPRATTDVFVVAAAGGPPRRLVRGGSDPDWSPDGRRIAYRCSAGGRSRICVIGADGKGRRAVTAGPHDHAPSWAPDGTAIAFVRGSARIEFLPVLDEFAGIGRLSVVTLRNGRITSIGDSTIAATPDWAA